MRCSRTSALPGSGRALNDDQRRHRDSSVAGGSFDSVCCHGLVTRGGGTGAEFGMQVGSRTDRCVVSGDGRADCLCGDRPFTGRGDCHRTGRGKLGGQFGKQLRILP